ncbi:MAG: hypothetical protein D4R64_14880 [Porphyromonadaceae bacterium]|nr:MAG: hypothetical protein D4R64_14880 [Porphyromonadaceae bacterium]
MQLKGSIYIRIFAVGLFTFLFFVSCEQTNLPPVAQFKISAYLADTIAILEFDASACSDPEDDQLALFIRWDFQGDGTWDTEYATQKVAAYRYRQHGLFHPVLEVKDQDDATDTLSLEIRITDIMKVSQLTDDRDGKTYKITLIEDTWWMSENLDYGKWILAPQGQENNGIVEKYYYNNDSAQKEFKGGLYTWKEVSGFSKENLPRGICPEGWQLPDGVALAKLFNKGYLVSPQEHLFGPGGFWNLDLPNKGGTYGWYHNYEFSIGDSHWWTGEYYGEYSNNKPYVILYYGPMHLIYYNPDGEVPYYYQAALPVRCIKKVQ